MFQDVRPWMTGLVSALFVFSGCSQPAATTTTPATPPPPAAAAADSETTSALAKLSEADRAAALKQDGCPVTGEKLGSMGAPPKVTVEGKEVFLCCEGCEEELRKEPAKYLAKLKSP